MLGNYLIFFLSVLLAAGFAVAATALLRVRDVAGFAAGALICGAAEIVLITTVLSLVDLWKPLPILILQILALGGAVPAARRRGDFTALHRVRELPREVTWARLGRNPIAVAALSLLAVVVAYELFVAIAAAPNVWDSMAYHLARIVYWMQNSSVLQFPLATERQAAFPPAAEYIQGWTMLLTRGDALVQTVQWTAQLGCFFAAWALARDFGYSRVQAVLPLLAIAALPVLMLQATSSQNDLILAFFVLAALLFLLRSLTPDRGAAILAGAAGGLAFATKPSAGMFLVAIGLAGAIVAGRDWRKLIAPGLALLAGALLLGGLNYAQNIADRGSVTGAPSQGVFRIHSVKEIPTNVSTMSWQAATSVPGGEFLKNRVWRIEDLWTRTLGLWAAKLSGDTNPGYKFTFDRTDDRIGLGLPLLLLILPALLWSVVRPRSRAEVAVAVAAFAAYLAVVLTLRNNPWTARFLMVPAVIAAPLSARLGGSRLMQLLGGVLLVFTLVTVGFSTLYRPVISSGQSVLEMDRAHQQSLFRPTELNFLRFLQQNLPQDARVGVVASANSYEYPFAGTHFDRTLVKLTPAQLTPDVFSRYDLDAIIVADVRPPRNRPGATLFQDKTHLLLIPQ